MCPLSEDPEVDEVETCKRIVAAIGWVILLALFGACDYLTRR